MRKETATAFNDQGIPITTTWVFLERGEYHDLMDDMADMFGDEMESQIDVFRGARHIPILARNNLTECLFDHLSIDTDWLSLCQEGMDHQAISIWAGIKREREGIDPDDSP